MRLSVLFIYEFVHAVVNRPLRQRSHRNQFLLFQQVRYHNFGLAGPSENSSIPFFYAAICGHQGLQLAAVKRGMVLTPFFSFVW